MPGYYIPKWCPQETEQCQGSWWPSHSSSNHIQYILIKWIMIKTIEIILEWKLYLRENVHFDVICNTYYWMFYIVWMLCYIYIRPIYFSLLCKIVNPLSIIPVLKAKFFAIEVNSLNNRWRMGRLQLLCRQHMDMHHKLRCRLHMGLQRYGLQHLLLCRRRCKQLGWWIVGRRRQLPRRRGR